MGVIDTCLGLSRYIPEVKRLNSCQLSVTNGYTQAGHGAGILHGASAKAEPVKTLDRLRRDLLIPVIPSQGKSTWSHCIGLSGCPGVPGWRGPRNRSGVQIV